jgi:hypothetical protein
MGVCRVAEGQNVVDSGATGGATVDFVYKREYCKRQGVTRQQVNSVPSALYEARNDLRKVKNYFPGVPTGPFVTWCCLHQVNRSR